MRHRLRAAGAAALGLAMIAAAPIVLAPARSTYTVSLDHALAGGLVAVRGRTVTEFRVTCDGYETTQRLVADMTDSQDNVSRSDFAVTVWESKTGRAMRFDITNMVDGEIAERYKGRATLEGDGSGEVALSLPSDTHFPLPRGTVFPTAQTIAILTAAEAGEHADNSTVFQGGGQSYLYAAAATIGKPSAPSQADVGAMLRGVPAWPVLISYFPAAQQAETPDYEIASRLYANGVIGSMTMIYARFTLKATLEKVEMLSTPSC